MDCGHSWVMNKQRETCTCPHCRAKLQVKETYERKLQQKQYFTILTTCGEFQVLRMFLLIVGMEKGYKAQTSIIEIGQYLVELCRDEKSVSCHTEGIGTLC